MEPAAAGDPVAETDMPPTPFDEPVALVSAQAPDVAPETPAATKKATRAKKTPTGKTKATNASAPREGSKTSQLIAMLRREGGTTLEEIISVMGWQQHTTRAMLSAGGSLAKKHGLVVTSEKVGDKRTYSIKA
jgi:cell division septation protein DedD